MTVAGVSMLAKVLVALSLFLSPSWYMTEAFMIRSEGSGGWGTGLAYDEETKEVIVVATTFDKSFWGVQDDKESECFVAVGNPLDTESVGAFVFITFDNPQLCVGGAVSFDTNRVPVAAVVGEHGDIATLQQLEFMLGIITTASAPPVQIHSNALPVAVANLGEEAIVALHPTAGDRFEQPADPSTALTSMVNYWNKYTTPVVDDTITTPSSPRVAKVNVMAGEPVSSLTLVVDLGAAYIGAVALTKDYQIIAGSINGRGEAFGESPGTGDWDGFVTFAAADRKDLQPDDNSNLNAIRISSQAGADDTIHAMCVYDHYVYVVGTTEGTLKGLTAGGAFVAKIGMAAQEVIWTYQESGLNVQGRACTAGEDAVYMAALTEIDTVDSQIAPSQRADAMLIKISASTGYQVWNRLIDTSLQEGDFRRDEIVDLHLNEHGNVHVLLNSLNFEKGENDIFLFDVQSENGDNDVDDLTINIEYPDLGEETSEHAPWLDEHEDDVKVAAIVIPVVLGLIIFLATVMQCKKKAASENIPKNGGTALDVSEGPTSPREVV